MTDVHLGFYWWRCRLFSCLKGLLRDNFFGWRASCYCWHYCDLSNRHQRLVEDLAIGCWVFNAICSRRNICTGSLLSFVDVSGVCKFYFVTKYTHICVCLHLLVTLTNVRICIVICTHFLRPLCCHSAVVVSGWYSRVDQITSSRIPLIHVAHE